MSKRRINSIRKRVLGVELELHPVVFPVGAGLLVAFVILAAIWPRASLMAFNDVRDLITDNFSWLYVASMSGFLIFALWLGASRYGSIRLGRDDERPEFSTVAWFAMLFSAGMGIGMVFFGVAEPMAHMMSPPSGHGGGTLGAAREAMGITLFHWCLHPWALYAIVAMALAYFGFRRGLPLSFRSVFYPLIGERIHGRIGDAIDVMAVLATLFGLATSLGLGAKQVNAGLAYVFGIPQGTGVQMILIACITAMAVTSLVSGLNVGIRILSEVNMVLAALLCLFLFVAGPTVTLLDSLVDNVGVYLTTMPGRSFWTARYEESSFASWFGGWTIFYWGWWIAWSPFVGMFIARVSKGRTIREFVAGVLLVPSAVAIVWMTGFGNSAMLQELAQGSERPTYDTPVLVTDDRHHLPLSADGRLVAPEAKRLTSPRGVLVEDHDRQLVAVSSGKVVEYRHGVLVDAETGSPYEPESSEVFAGRFRAEERELSLGGYLSSAVLNDAHTRRRDTTATAMFLMLRAYPLHWLTALIGTLSIVLFFVTSSDSASMVADMIASGGSENPTTGTRLFWGILEGVLAAVLLGIGGLVALQTGSIALGLPFCVIIIVMCYSLLRGLREDVAGDLSAEHRAYIRGADVAEEQDEEADERRDEEDR